MPSILNLKFKGNKSFVAFSNLNDSEALAKTWKVCTKVASYLEQGQRLENLSWRLWHVQSLMVDSDNAKSKREFKKLSKSMGDKLDKEKGRSIEELEAPDFKHNHSAEMIRKRAAEKEREREASQNAQPGIIKRTQFTFSVEQPIPIVSNASTRKPDDRHSTEFKNATKSSLARATPGGAQNDAANHKHDNDCRRKPTTNDAMMANPQSHSLRFPTLFSSDFGPSALLHASPTLTTHMNYGEDARPNSTEDGLSIVRPTIELPLDELLTNVDAADSPGSSSNSNSDVDTRRSNSDTSPLSALSRDEDVVMKSAHDSTIPYRTSYPHPIVNNNKQSDEDEAEDEDDESDESDDSDLDLNTNSVDSGTNISAFYRHTVPPLSQTVKEILPKSIAPSKIGPRHTGSGTNTPVGRPTLTVRTQPTPNTRSSGPGATATSVNPVAIKHSGAIGHNNSAPGGVKAECSNCGATHTPLWRRGLNDELNCNACGLYCKLHKRPRPKSMRNNHGEGRTQAVPRHESIDVMAQCYNCHTTATPLWRKDDLGKTVCNACGLYYKLHGSARPISMKSDVIRKRSRHDARRAITAAETPTASPGVSRRPSPAREISPTLAPDSTTQLSYDYHEESDYRTSQSELMGALGPEATSHHHVYSSRGYTSFPGPYHPDYIMQLYSPPSDPLPFASVDVPDVESIGVPRRTTKRRRMSIDSASEPPSSAVSFSSYNDGYSTSSSATSHSQRSSMEFPFSAYPHYHFLRGSGTNAFWHPPMLPQDHSPQVIHPPMLPALEDSPMDYLHPPMLPNEDDNLLSTYFHPPMLLPDDSHVQYSNDGVYAEPSEHYDTNMHPF